VTGWAVATAVQVHGWWHTSTPGRFRGDVLLSADHWQTQVGAVGAAARDEIHAYHARVREVARG
jgi:hypothetical protein